MSLRSLITDLKDDVKRTFSGVDTAGSLSNKFWQSKAGDNLASWQTLFSDPKSKIKFGQDFRYNPQDSAVKKVAKIGGNIAKNFGEEVATQVPKIGYDWGQLAKGVAKGNTNDIRFSSKPAIFGEDFSTYFATEDGTQNTPRIRKLFDTVGYYKGQGKWNVPFTQIKLPEMGLTESSAFDTFKKGLDAFSMPLQAKGISSPTKLLGMLGFGSGLSGLVNYAVNKGEKGSFEQGAWQTAYNMSPTVAQSSGLLASTDKLTTLGSVPMQSLTNVLQGIAYDQVSGSETTGGSIFIDALFPVAGYLKTKAFKSFGEATKSIEGKILQSLGKRLRKSDGTYTTLAKWVKGTRPYRKGGAGALFGFEMTQDEDGKWRVGFNSKKALMGIAIMTGGTKALKNLDSKSLGDNAGKNELEDILKAQNTKDLDPLISEARKYKSAEEFVRAKTNAYHQTNSDIKVFNDKSPVFFNGENRPPTFGNKTIETFVNFKKPYEAGEYVPPSVQKTLIPKLQKEGYDGVIFRSDPNNPSKITMSVSLKPSENTFTKSQLIDIWNKANAKPKVVEKTTPKVEKIEPSLISEARKYKSAEELPINIKREIVRKKPIGSDVIDKIKELGIPINDDGSITLYHGTSSKNASNIDRNGFNGMTWFDTKNGSMADMYSGQGKGKIYEVKVDPSALKVAGGKAYKDNFFVSQGKLVKDADGVYRLSGEDLRLRAKSYVDNFWNQASKAGGGVTDQVGPVRSKNLPDTSSENPSFLKSSIEESNIKTNQNIPQNQPKDSRSSFSSKPIIPQGTDKSTSLEDIENIVYGSKTGADITGTKTGNTPLRKIENFASNNISKALTNPNKYVRTMASAMQDLIGGAGKSQAQVRARAEYRGGVDYATKVASDTQNYIYKILNNDNKSLERVHSVLDPNISKIKVDEKSLTVNEKEAVETLRKVSDLINDTNYANGFITKTQWAKNKGGKYVARAYETFDYPPEVADFVRDKSIRFDLNPFKQRGEITDWKVENSIKDPAYLMSKRLQQTLFNTEIKKYTSWAKSAGLISDVQKPGFVQLSDSKAYGDVAGKWIRKDSLEDVKGFFFTNDVGQKAYDVLNWYDRNPIRKFQKSLKTVFNPAVRLGNRTGNYVFAWLNGINPVTFGKNKSWAKKAVKNNDPLYRYAMKNGIMGTDVTKADIARVSADLKRGVKDKNILQQIDSVAKESYGRVDDTSKLSALKTWIDRGYSIEEALNRTRRGFQDYNMVGMLYDIGAKIPVLGNPFVRFSSESMRIAKNAVVDHPIRAISTVAAWVLFKDVMSRMTGETDEEKKIRETRVGAAHIPFTNISMNVQTPWGEVNASRLVGFSTTFTPEDSNLSDVSKYSPIQNPLDARNYGTDPVIGPIISLATDKDFRGKSIADPDQNKYQGSLLTDKERNLNRLGYLGRSYAPPTATDIYNIGSAFQGKPNVYGQVKTPTQAILRTYPGVKVEQFGPEQVASYKEREKKFNEYLLKSIDSKIKGIQKDIDSGLLNPVVGRNRINELQKQKITEVSTSVRKFEESPEAPKTIPEKVKLAAQGIGVDPLNTIKAIFTEERMRKVSGNAMIFEREEYLNKTPSEDDAVDHIIPLSLGGDNSKGNLRYISKEANQEKAKLETKLSRQLASGEITKSEARKQIKEWVDTYEIGDTYTSTNTSTDTTTKESSTSTPTYEGGYIEYTAGKSKKKVKKVISVPKLTSNTELNKKLLSTYKSDLTDYENYIMYQYESGAITEEKAGSELEKIDAIRKWVSNKTKKPSTKKAKKVDLAAISQKTLKPVKVQISSPKFNTFEVLSGYKKAKAPTIEAPNLKVIDFKTAKLKKGTK